jgi:hypothetical protein
VEKCGIGDSERAYVYDHSVILVVESLLLAGALNYVKGEENYEKTEEEWC